MLNVYGIFHFIGFHDNVRVYICRLKSLLVTRIIFFILLLVFSFSCTREGNNSNVEDGAIIALQRCSGCHAFVSPDKLPKSSWKEDVLPHMGSMLGVYDQGKRPESLFERGEAGQRVKNANIFPKEQQISTEEWQSIVNYYLTNAPDSINNSHRESPIHIGLPHFESKPYKLPSAMPLTSFVKILPETSQVAFGTTHGHSHSFNILSADLKHVQSFKSTELPIEYYKLTDDLYSLTTIGKGLFPTDAAEGGMNHVTSANQESVSNENGLVLNGLQRPVYSIHHDLNADGLADIIVCEFGSLTGKLAWYENKGSSYEGHTLIAKPGASRVVVEDMDADGRPDILALMAQANEGIYFLRNTENGFAPARQLLMFSPLSGSTYFDYIDFNGDGIKDIIYTCGDNADKTPFLKKDHGIYIFLGQGDLQFKQHFFYPLNGAYKAIAKDYDLDGDLDIAAISYFPDYEQAPEEGFVYLQNQGNMKFEVSSFSDVGIGRWISMDADDFDHDGDTDIVLGSNISITPMGDHSGINDRWLKEGVSLIILKNKIKKSR